MYLNLASHNFMVTVVVIYSLLVFTCQLLGDYGFTMLQL